MEWHRALRRFTLRHTHSAAGPSATHVDHSVGEIDVMPLQAQAFRNTESCAGGQKRQRAFRFSEVTHDCIRLFGRLSGSTTATRVYGQMGSFTTHTANLGGISANSLENPAGLALDSSGNLYVADAYNNRVLFYLSGSTTARGSTGSWAASLPTPRTTAGSAPTAYLNPGQSPWTAAAISTRPTLVTIAC